MNPHDITAEHRARLACVYIRQSSFHQVLHHKESQIRQRALVDRAIDLGWPSDRVILLDEDLGHSASGSSPERQGFQTLATETALGKIGIILGLEVARISRANRDWYYLLDICAVRRTLIADVEGLYDPRAYNDRLLLGMKGTMSEAELHIMKQRMVEAMLGKARRGEFHLRVPCAFLWDEAGRLRKNPDEQVASVTALVFERFLELGTVNQTQASLAEEGILLPIQHGKRSKIVWKPPSYDRVYHVLTNPVYAGAYAYGRRQTEEILDSSNRPAKRQREKEQQDWHSLIKDHHEGYVSWETFEKIQHRIALNRRAPQGPGAPREGRALLQGLILCGKCGRRMKLAYGKKGHLVRYVCVRRRQELGISPCQSFGAIRLEKKVEDLVLKALEPLGIEAMIQAASLHGETNAAQRAHWEQRVERAQYEVEVARRQYDAVDPTNRLVARELERRFEESLKSLDATKAQAQARIRDLDHALTREEEERLRRYAGDLPLLWQASTTRPQDKKRIVQCLIQNVVLTPTNDGEDLKAEVHWRGGEITALEVPKGKSGVNGYATAPEVVELVKNLAQEYSDDQIARILHRKHIRTAKGLPFNTRRIIDFRSLHGIPRCPGVLHQGENVYTAEQAAEIFAVSRPTITRWLEEGLLRGSQLTGNAPWRILVTEEDRKRLLASDAPRDWLPLKGAAHALRVSQQTVLQRLKAGKLEGVRVRVGRRSGWRIRIPETSCYKQKTLFE